MSPRATRPIPIGSTFGTIFPVRSGRKWRAVVEVSPPEGGRFQVGRSGVSFDEASAELERVIREAATSAKRRWTMTDLVEAWETFHRGAHSTLEESSRRHYRDTWRLYIEGFTPEGSRLPLGQREPASITRQEVFECVHAVEGKAKYVKDAIRSIFRFAVNRGVVPVDATAGGFGIKSTKPEPKPLDVTTIERIETHLASLERRGRRTDPLLLHDVWVLMRASAARIGEALALQVGDIDWETGQIKLAQRHIAKVETPAGTVTEDIKPGGKTRAATRTVVVSQRVLETALRVRCTDMRGDDPSGWKLRAVDEWVFRTDQGWFVTPSSYRSRLERELKKLTLGRTVTPHDLRDTAATAIVRQLTTKYGVHEGLREAAAMLGHGGIGPALLAYVEQSSTVVDHSAVLDDLDPKAVREKAQRTQLEAIAATIDFSQVIGMGAGSFALAALADDLTAAARAIDDLDFGVLLVELDPDEVEF